MQLTQKVDLWPDAVGVAATATIISHYQRRGDYRVHAAAIGSATANGGGGVVTRPSAYTHTFTKGDRERAGEDVACSLLAVRALAFALELPAAEELAELGVRVAAAEEDRVNAVGEVAAAAAVEVTPIAVPVDMAAHTRDGPRILVPRAEAPPVELVAPAGLPEGTVVVMLDGVEDSKAAHAAAGALRLLGRQGDGGQGSWSIPAAPVLFFSDEAAAARFGEPGATDSGQAAAAAAVNAHVSNWVRTLRSKVAVLFPSPPVAIVAACPIITTVLFPRTCAHTRIRECWSRPRGGRAIGHLPRIRSLRATGFEPASIGTLRRRSWCRRRWRSASCSACWSARQRAKPTGCFGRRCSARSATAVHSRWPRATSWTMATPEASAHITVGPHAIETSNRCCSSG